MAIGYFQAFNSYKSELAAGNNWDANGQLVDKDGKVVVDLDAADSGSDKVDNPAAQD
eukprot:SAG22_NODE_380_length_11402_cov_8.514154_12_plen_57_part_00